MQISKAIGIDLGTTNSAVAIMDRTDTDIIIHRDPTTGSQTTPSCVWRDPRTGEVVVGRKALRRIGGLPAPIRSIKRLMGQRTTVRLGDEDVTPEQVSAHIVGEVKRQIESDLDALGTESMRWLVERAVITVPAYFDQPNIDATRRAGEMAGLEVLDLLHEPTAAASYHCWRTGTTSGLFLVYDFGGGTFDVTVLRSTGGVFEVLGISGNSRLGGDDLDAALAEQLQQQLVDEDYAMDLDVRGDVEDARRFAVLRRLAESVKVGLSSSGEYLLRDAMGLKDKLGEPVSVETMFERPQLEALIGPIVERTIPYCFDALEQAECTAGVTLADVDAVVLAGGSTHVPLTREIVRQHLCAPLTSEQLVDPRADQPRAKCTEPVYERVDTVVALGAGIRAGATGGLAVYNPERTVRVSFRGVGATGAAQTHVGGRVEALAPEIDLTDASVRVRIADLDYEDEQPLKSGGAFAFTRLPLQPSAENLLSFDVYDRSGALIATAGRPVVQDASAARPTGGEGTAVLTKPILIEVMRAGAVTRKLLFSAPTTLPVTERFPLMHPGDTELVRIPLYQHRRKIQEILVPVESSLPRGTAITLDVHIDGRSFITVRGTVGDTEFGAAVEQPPDRELPTAAEAEALEREYEQVLEYHRAGRQNVARLKFRGARESFAAAVASGDDVKAVSDFEEMEDLVAEASTAGTSLKPPKEFFDDLVKECDEFNRGVAQLARERGEPHDEVELQRSIEALRQQGERAFGESDQQAYADAIDGLDGVRAHLVSIARKLQPDDDGGPTRAERLTSWVASLGKQAERLRGIASAVGRHDHEATLADISGRLSGLAGSVAANPETVEREAAQIAQHLERIDNLLRRGPDEGGDLAEDVEEGRPA